MRNRTKLVAISVAAILMAATALTVRWLRDRPVHHFGMVQQGVLYRGGQPGRSGLNQIISDYGIKTVVNLRNRRDQDWWRTEADVCRQRGVRMIDLPLGTRSGYVSGLKEFLSVANDKANYPIFVHCEAGSARTGYAVAAFRIVHQGWSHDRAMAEASKFRFKMGVGLNDEYDKILQKLAAGADWRTLDTQAASSPTSTASTHE